MCGFMARCRMCLFKYNGNVGSLPLFYLCHFKFIQNFARAIYVDRKLSSANLGGELGDSLQSFGSIIEM